MTYVSVYDENNWLTGTEMIYRRKRGSKRWSLEMVRQNVVIERKSCDY